MVDTKSPEFQQVLPNSSSKYFDNKGVCIQERLGCILSVNSNGRKMEFIGTATYKSIGYKSIENDGRNYYCSILKAVSD